MEMPMWIRLLPIVLLAAVEMASGQTYTEVYAFTGGSDGSDPETGVVADAAGNLYGTTSYGGPAGYGTVYELPVTGGEKTIHDFSSNWDGAYPKSGVIVDNAGNLYGTAQQGGNTGCQDFGCGVVFRINPTHADKALHIFLDGRDGGFPIAGLTRDQAGDLYGTTQSGGIGYGVIFRMDASGHESVLDSFSGPDGNAPDTKLVRDNAGNMYGATYYGGKSCNGVGCGVVFRLNRTGKLTVLYKFSGGTDGGIPTFGTLTLDGAGNIYGTTNYGGDLSCHVGVWPGCGVVYKLDPAGNQTVLYSFHHGSDGAIPSSGVLLDRKGNLYGATLEGGDFSGNCKSDIGCGVIFRLSPTGEETVLHTFQYDDGAYPGGDLLVRQGFLYGTAGQGGSTGLGVVFKLQL
jgi:uncharacterized repeat protein (TIGR03803 family)